MERIKVKDATHLRELIETKSKHFFIQLNFGLRSSKFISMDGDHFCVLNEIDGTEDYLNESDLFDESLTNIGKAIRLGAFFCEC